MWRDEIYERAPDFKSKVSVARFRSAEWRFLAALDGERSAGEIARALGYDEAAAAAFVNAQETSGTIVASLLSFEQFEKVAGPLLPADEIARDFPEAGLAALRDAQDALVSSKPMDGRERTDVENADSENSAPSATPLAAPNAVAKIDTSIGAALEGLKKLRARAAEANAAATAANTPVAAIASTSDPVPSVGPIASASDFESAPELDEARASLVESLAQPEPPAESERAIVHRSATVIPLSSMLERVHRPEKVDAEAAAWNAVLERMRETSSNGTPINGNGTAIPPPLANGAPPADATSPDTLPPPPRNVRRLPFGKRPEV